jgi:hypothetical protein
MIPARIHGKDDFTAHCTLHCTLHTVNNVPLWRPPVYTHALSHPCRRNRFTAHHTHTYTPLPPSRLSPHTHIHTHTHTYTHIHTHTHTYTYIHTFAPFAPFAMIDLKNEIIPNPLLPWSGVFASSSLTNEYASFMMARKTFTRISKTMTWKTMKYKGPNTRLDCWRAS